MASPHDEQSDAMQHELSTLPSDEVLQLSNVTVKQQIDTAPDNLHPSAINFLASRTELIRQRDRSSEFHHHACDKREGASGSAFHIVSNVDREKELDQSSYPSHSMNVGSENGMAGDATEMLKSPPNKVPEKHAKHFSAHIVDQLGHDDLPKEDSKRMYTETDEAGRENEMLGITDSRTDMQGIAIEDIDDAVEKSLLSEADDDDSLSKEGTRHMNEDMELSQLSTQATEVSDFQFLKPNSFDILGNIKESTMEQDPGGADSDIKNELRIKKTMPIHVPEKVFNIDEETRMGLDQTPVDTALLSSSFIYPSLPPKKLFQLDDTKDSEASDPETKISMMTDTEDIRLRNTISIDDATKDSVASDSNTEAATPTRRARRASREGLGISMMEGLEGGERIFTAENLFEYQWPQDGGDWHLLQEQISEYLKVKSFKRKYPDLYRRTCDKEEKDFLREKGVVTETQSDLGLTALRSEEVYDLMMKDYSDKYKEYISVLQEKQKKVIHETHKEYSAQAKLDKSKIEAYSKKAAQSAAEFNASLMREKKDERRAYFDLQTYTIHFPKNKFHTLPSYCTKVGPYPVSLLSGQFQQHFKKYTSEELKYYPVKTSLKDPPKYIKYVRPPPPGLRVSSGEKQKVANGPGDEESINSIEADVTANEENVEVKAECNEKENEILQVKELEVPQPPVRLEKKVKSTTKKKPAKPVVSPDKVKTAVKKTEGEKTEEKEEQSGDENESSPSGTKMPPKIHGLEKCRICKKRSTKEERKNDKLVKCAECGKIGHMGCLDLTEELVAVIKTYPWQCMECKTCVECLDPFDEDKMMFCDRCDRGYHTFCIGLDALPTGHWECKSCEGCPKIIPKSKFKKIPQGGHTPEMKTEPEVKELKNQRVKEMSSVEKSVLAQHEKEDYENNVAAGRTDNVAGGEESSSPGRPSNETKDTTDTVTSEKNNIADVAWKIGKDQVYIPSNTSAKIERRGRKRKIPDGQKPNISKADSSTKPKVVKQGRIQGARQSRRLKLKEEEEEEKKKKEEEKKKQKKKKKKQFEAGEAGEKTVEVADMDNLKVKNETLKILEIQGGISVTDDPKDIVSEGVDDSAVHIFDKMEDEEKEMEVESTVMNNDKNSEGCERTSQTDKVSTSQLQHHPETTNMVLGNIETTTLVEEITSSLKEAVLVNREKNNSALDVTGVSHSADSFPLELRKNNNTSTDMEISSTGEAEMQSTESVILQQSSSAEKMQQSESLSSECVNLPPAETFGLSVSESMKQAMPVSVNLSNMESHNQPVLKPTLTTAEQGCISSNVPPTLEVGTLSDPPQIQQISVPLHVTPSESATSVALESDTVPGEEKNAASLHSLSSGDNKALEMETSRGDPIAFKDTHAKMSKSQEELTSDIEEAQSKIQNSFQMSEGQLKSTVSVDDMKAISSDQE